MGAPLVIAMSRGEEIVLLPNMANRHGLITGATGTGKTVTLQKMAESFSSIGTPVFMADVKGDLSGIGAAGVASEKLLNRLASIGISDFQPRANTTVFWDVFGEKGHPVRATISDMGPLLLARLLNLNDTQTGVLTLSLKLPMTTACFFWISKTCGRWCSLWVTMPGNSPPSTATFPPHR